MEKSINLKILETREQLIKVASDSGLPAMVIQMIYNEVGMMLEQSVKVAITQEQEQLSISEKKESEKEAK